MNVIISYELEDTDYAERWESALGYRVTNERFRYNGVIVDVAAPGENFLGKYRDAHRTLTNYQISPEPYCYNSTVQASYIGNREGKLDFLSTFGAIKCCIITFKNNYDNRQFSVMCNTLSPVNQGWAIKRLVSGYQVSTITIESINYILAPVTTTTAISDNSKEIPAFDGNSITINTETDGETSSYANTQSTSYNSSDTNNDDTTNETNNENDTQEKDVYEEGGDVLNE